MLNSPNPSLQDQQAWELVQSRAWKEILAPLLVAKAKWQPSPITGLDSAFEVAGEAKAAEYAKYLYHQMNMMAYRHIKQPYTADPDALKPDLTPLSARGLSLWQRIWTRLRRNRL